MLLLKMFQTMLQEERDIQIIHPFRKNIFYNCCRALPSNTISNILCSMNSPLLLPVSICHMCMKHTPKKELAQAGTGVVDSETGL